MQREATHKALRPCASVMFQERRVTWDGVPVSGCFEGGTGGEWEVGSKWLVRRQAGVAVNEKTPRYLMPCHVYARAHIVF